MNKHCGACELEYSEHMKYFGKLFKENMLLKKKLGEFNELKKENEYLKEYIKELEELNGI